MNTSEFQIPKQSATLRALVEEKLRSLIAGGHFTPGQRLVERELCELLGVGRTSVREALRQLEAEGLITVFPHRGPIVSTITYEEAEQLYKVRALLEGFAGQEFAERGSPADMEKLVAAVQAFVAAARLDDRNALISAKTRFYDCLLDGSGNFVIRQMLTSLHNRVTLLRFTSMTQPGRLEHSIEEIRAIADAIVQRNGPKAAAACKYHIDMAARVALEYLRKTADLSKPR